MENIGSLRSCLVCDDALVISNVIGSKVVDEQSLVQQMDVCLGTFFQVLSLGRNINVISTLTVYCIVVIIIWLIKRVFPLEIVLPVGRDRIFNNPSFKGGIQRVVDIMTKTYGAKISRICRKYL